MMGGKRLSKGTTKKKTWRDKKAADRGHKNLTIIPLQYSFATPFPSWTSKQCLMLLLQFFMASVAASIACESDISQSFSLSSQFPVNKTTAATRKARGRFIFSENHKPSVSSKAGISFFAKYITVNHNLNKILESGWLPAVAVLALFGQFLSSVCPDAIGRRVMN